MGECFPHEFKEQLREQARLRATMIFRTIEKMLTTEAGTPEREQVLKEFINYVTCEHRKASGEERETNEWIDFYVNEHSRKNGLK